MAVGDIYRVSVEQFTAQGGDLINVFHMRTSVSVGSKENEMESLAKAVGDWWQTNMAPSMCNLVSLQKVVIRDVNDPLFGWQEDFQVSAGQAGDMLPLGAALELLIKSASPLRRANGKQYIAGLIEGTQTNSFWEAATQQAFRDAYTLLFNLIDITFAGVFEFELGIYSRTYLEFAKAVNVLSISGTRSQKRRNPGIGS